MTTILAPALTGAYPLHAEVLDPADAKPYNTSIPTIIGTAREEAALEADVGEWANDPIDYGYQWLIGGVVVSFETLAWPRTSHIGQTVLLGVRAGNEHGWSDWVYSTPTAAVIDGFNMYFSNSGNNANPGTRASPKKDISSVTINAGQRYGLERGSVFRESVTINVPSTAWGCYGSDEDAPIITGMDTTVAASWVNNGNGTYSYTWTAQDVIVKNGYDDVITVEIDTTLEATHPILARRQMASCATLGAVASTTGGSFEALVGGKVWTTTIKPSDGAAPGTRYRYEVTSRYYGFWWTSTQFAAQMDGLTLIVPSYGYGALGTPIDFTGRRLTILQQTAHGSVGRGGLYEDCVWYGAGGGFSHTFYVDVGTGHSWTLRRGMFYANDGDGGALYSHTSGEFDWVSGAVEGGVVGGSRSSDGALKGFAMGFRDIALVNISGVYVKGRRSGLDETVQVSGNPLATINLTDSVFRQIGYIVGHNTVSNNHIQVENISGSGPSNVTTTGMICTVFQKSATTVTRNLYHAKSVDTGNGQTDFNVTLFEPLTAFGITLSGQTFSHHIMVLDVAGDIKVTTHPGTYNATVDYMLYIYVRGTFKGVGSTATTFAAYQALTGWDAHSAWIEVDSLDDIFEDAANGVFKFKDNPQGRAAEAFRIAYEIGPEVLLNGWPERVPVDEMAVSLMRAA